MTLYTDQARIMAIGDSMYQGVRSLTFTADLARFSPPAQVAAQLRWPMTLPDPAQPVLFDLEEMFRAGALLHLFDKVRGACLENVRLWLADTPWSTHEAFDNVAIGGAMIGSLWGDTFNGHWPKVLALVDRIRTSPSPDIVAMGELWYALDVCFTLNPRRRPEQGAKSQLDQVTDRRPEVLLVNVGSNEGLFKAAFAGDFGEGNLRKVREIPEKMDALADRLRALPAAVERIVFNSLIRPRVASNLTPREYPRQRPPYYTGDGYFETYIPYLGDGSRDISARQLSEFDKLVRNVNDDVRVRLETRVGPRLRFVDLYEASSRNDGKHYEDRALAVGRHGKLLRNVPIDSFFGRFSRGGMTGLDNMHPSVPGYAVIADAVLAALQAAGVAVANPVTDKEKAFADDTLLNDLPVTWSITKLEFALLGLLGIFRS
jgi:lysophospholipase L1-like esterase